MFHLPNLLVVSSTYSKHFFLTRRVCVRPCDRHCGTASGWIWLNQPITVLRLIRFSKEMSKMQLITKCAMLKNVILCSKIKVMARGQSSISKCQKSKITCFGNNFVMNSWIFIWFWQKIKRFMLLTQNGILFPRSRSYQEVNDQIKSKFCLFGL